MKILHLIRTVVVGTALLHFAAASAAELSPEVVGLLKDADDGVVQGFLKLRQLPVGFPPSQFSLGKFHVTKLDQTSASSFKLSHSLLQGNGEIAGTTFSIHVPQNSKISSVDYRNGIHEVAIVTEVPNGTVKSTKAFSSFRDASGKDVVVQMGDQTTYHLIGGKSQSVHASYISGKELHIARDGGRLSSVRLPNTIDGTIANFEFESGKKLLVRVMNRDGVITEYPFESIANESGQNIEFIAGKPKVPKEEEVEKIFYFFERNMIPAKKPSAGIPLKIKTEQPTR